METLNQAADAVLLVSFGGPEAADDVLPFLRRVTAGRGVPDERLAQVAEHYYARGGVSPINAANRALRTALQAELARRGHPLPVLWGNRNAAPFLAEALLEAKQRGFRRLRVVVTSLVPSYSGCRQYRENLAEALARSGLENDFDLALVDFVCDTDGFIAAQIDACQAALDELGRAALDEPARPAAELVFVAHSIPLSMAAAAGPAGDEYVGRLRAAAQRVHHGVSAVAPGRVAGWRLAYCSRSGAPAQPWLEPDVNDALAALARTAPRPVVVVPIGFVSDHMEVVHDLDTVAAATARSHGLPFARAATVDTDPRFVAAVVDQIERTARRCRSGCCPNERAPRTPVVGGVTDQLQQASQGWRHAPREV